MAISISQVKSPFSRLRRPSLSNSNTASTPDLASAYSQSKLLRKTSLAALTPSSLASIPDVSESYAIDSVLNEAPVNTIHEDPETPSTMELSVGDSVNVPGGMVGTVRFVGTVQGKKGTFVGVELDSEFAARGKNNGDVDGVSYFTTNAAGAGIFVPVAKALRRSSGPSPMTPTPGSSGLKLSMSNSVSLTPPTSGLSKLGASVGPGSRVQSPQGKKPRPSLQPDSPQRKMAMSPGPRPSISAPAVRAPSRLGSPTGKFSQSVRGTAGHLADPNKKGPAMERRPSFGPRSTSSLGPEPLFDEEPAPIAMPTPPAKINTSLGSLSLRPPSRATSINDEEIERLRTQLEDRDRQLKEQAATLAEMESSLTELQTLIENPDGLGMRRSSIDDKDASQLRHMLREKNDKIAMLTVEFDAHRADFRSTIDTLEMASTETERVYEKRIEELIADIRELESRNMDVDSVATQLKQLEELVQELEEGLEDARRGEAEARGEAEFLRGEVERTRSELRREKERVIPHNTAALSGDSAALAKSLEQKEDEIRGLKAIIHSLSRDSIPGAEGHAPRPRPGSLIGEKDAIENKIARDNLERQVAELQQVLKEKNHREEELQHEIEFLRSNNVNTSRESAPIRRSSIRDSRDTVMSTRSHEPRAHEPRSPELSHKRISTLDTMHESDTYSTATESSTLWCEICETGGHDILTCTNMFGNDSAKNSKPNANPIKEEDEDDEEAEEKARRENAQEDLKPLTPTGDEIQHPAVLTPGIPKEEPTSVPAVRITPNPLESGPVAGKESGVLDLEKWCAICERDGHDSVDCPFEDAF
ncbi:hypothetical protein TrVFT333_005129 [Trichoderma virens FT-333]|nr:hypothetical protein TrVFT333_005129 [Trichoderma virens FT-333]